MVAVRAGERKAGAVVSITIGIATPADDRVRARLRAAIDERDDAFIARAMRNLPRQPSPYGDMDPVLRAAPRWGVSRQ